LCPGRRVFSAPRPGLKEINVVCWTLFCLCLVAPIRVVLGLQTKTGNLYFEKSPVDFIYFYGTWQIVKTHPTIDVYDYQWQLEEFNSIQALKWDVRTSPLPAIRFSIFQFLCAIAF
jgi:hypothetical protein